jgi:hypothetical protein
MSTCDTLEGFVEVASAQRGQVVRARRKSALPVELREAEELLIRYGKWAQDRYQKRRCASAEGHYRPPPMRGQEDEPLQPFMPDWSAMKVQHALVVVPMQYRRVLHAYYIPQRRPHHAVRRELKIAAGLWEQSRIEGIRRFWAAYLRSLTR